MSRMFTAVPVYGGRSWRALGSLLGGECTGEMCWVHAIEHVQQREALNYMYMWQQQGWVFKTLHFMETKEKDTSYTVQIKLHNI